MRTHLLILQVGATKVLVDVRVVRYSQSKRSSFGKAKPPDIVTDTFPNRLPRFLYAKQRTNILLLISGMSSGD